MGEEIIRIDYARAFAEATVYLERRPQLGAVSGELFVFVPDRLQANDDVRYPVPALDPYGRDGAAPV